MCGMRSWKHTSVTLDDDHILIFGGLAHKNKRFDDVWIFEVCVHMAYVGNA